MLFSGGDSATFESPAGSRCERDLNSAPAPAAHTCADWQRVEEFAYRFGRGYDSYLILEPDRECFWSRDGQGLVGYVRLGRYVKVPGGLLAADGHKAALLREFLQFAHERRLRVSFYNICEDELPLFSQCGLQITKWGEEPIVDLRSCSWEGKPFEWVRRQTNFCHRKGLEFRECRRETCSAAEWDGVKAELRQISAELLSTRPQASEMKLLQGELDPENLGRKRIFIARADSGRGRIEGFLACNPGMNGDFWSFEIYQHRPDAVRGTIPFLMHQAMQVLQREGARYVSLCLVPGVNCQQRRPGDSALARWGLVIGTQYFGFLFDAAGMYHFKSRFRPRFESRYLCVCPKVTLGSSWAFIRLLGVLRLDWRKIARMAWQRLRKPAGREPVSASEEPARPAEDADPGTRANARPGAAATRADANCSPPVQRGSA